MLVFADSTAPVSPFLPGLVFVAELCVVTLSTVRIICLGRGQKVLASAIGFFEVSIWLFAIGQIMQNLSNLGCYLGFAGGFTAGNFLGVLVEKRLGIGTLVVRVITAREAVGLAERLRAAHYGVTSLEGRGAAGPVTVVLTVIPRKELAGVVAIIKGFDPRCFYSVDDVQSAEAGVFPRPRGGLRGVVPAPLLRLSARLPRALARPARVELARVCVPLPESVPLDSSEGPAEAP
ncbi:MAG TPA: DUF5698 domain-containing protein [Gemmataceae bacterium]|nr:DUF5698 domain-containing protein [Gemmataceae bacterium]